MVPHDDVKRQALSALQAAEVTLSYCIPKAGQPDPMREKRIRESLAQIRSAMAKLSEV